MVRSSLTPIALPAVPALALHAATKSYCDGLDPFNLVGADDCFARYESGSAQTCANTSNVVVAHGTASETHALITQSTNGAGHKYTFNATGIYAVCAQARFLGGGSAGERFHSIDSSMYAGGGLAYWSTYTNGSTPITMGVHLVSRFTSGSYVTCVVYQNSGGNLDLEGNVSWKNICISLIRKCS